MHKLTLELNFDSTDEMVAMFTRLPFLTDVVKHTAAPQPLALVEAPPEASPPLPQW